MFITIMQKINKYEYKKQIGLVSKQNLVEQKKSRIDNPQPLRFSKQPK